jgi:hypothetical protein
VNGGRAAGAPSQEKDDEESHTPILVQPIGMYKYA